ncbi:unnamed protein product [Chrysoparadoxa australica]
MLTCQKGHMLCIKHLIDGVADVNATDGGDKTALIHAATDGHLSVVQYLLDKRAKVCMKDSGKWRALHFASRYGHSSCVALLLDSGADINDEAGERHHKGYTTALEFAVLSGHTNYKNWLRES